MFNVGQAVKILVNELPYKGIIITYIENEDLYKISVLGLGEVLDFKSSDILTLN